MSTLSTSSHHSSVRPRVPACPRVSRDPALTSAAGLYLVDRVGRRLLTLVSYAGILVSLLLLGVGFTLSE